MQLTRDQIRAALIGKAHHGERIMVTLFGVDVELRQPSLGAVLQAREDSDPKTRVIEMFVNYAYVPGTDERVFEISDRDVILQWPFNKDLLELQKAVSKLTGVNVGEAEEEIKADPLGD